ncbi:MULTISPECIES: NAD(P)/FAD-dependent oxidoreductase [unclassified Campylobacter]|uniref:NAD(P)/FAD-dependent oxidoreductase n=1 Tax=unclassified Campylobacter TaxID=2593542 RepID=UPI003D335127
MIYDAIIVGGGASGLFLAANLKELNVLVLEKNRSAGNKILASGGGRCNITNKNISSKNYLGDENFISNSLNNLNYKDILNFFSELNFSEQKSSQFFCDSGAKAVLEVLLSKIMAEILYNHEVISANKNGEIFEISCQNQAIFKSKKLIIASGGISYKTLGVSDVGLKIAHKFGLKTAAFTPALVGFTVQKDEFWFKNLSGVSIKAEISLTTKVDKGKFCERKFSGDILFTHKGISGPVILNASLFWQKGQLSLNFLPNFSKKQLIQGKKQLSSVLPLPKSFVLEFLRTNSLKDAPYKSFSHEQRDKILKLFDYRFAPAGTFGFERAEVCRGGVLTSGLDENFQAKGINGLYFVGEVLDITGMLGGFNIHFAFASAKCVAQDILRINCPSNKYLKK